MRIECDAPEDVSSAPNYRCSGMFFNFRPYELLSFINYFTFDRCGKTSLRGISNAGIETLSTISADESRKACNLGEAETEYHFINNLCDHDQ